MDEKRAGPEVGRVLRDGGRFGILWTTRNREVAWVRNLDRLPGEETPGAESADPFRRLDVVLPDSRIFGNVARQTFRLGLATE